MDEHEGSAPNAEPTLPELNARNAASGTPSPFDTAEFRAARDFFRATGGSVLYCLSAVSIFAGISSIVGPVLGSTSALSSTLPAIGAIGLYELSLFAVLLALVLRWAIVRDAVSLLILVAVFLVTLGMLVSTVANDTPRAVLGVGVAVAMIAVGQLLLMRRFVHIPFGPLSLIGIGILFVWNGVASTLIADYIGADVVSVRTVSDVWPFAAWIPVVASLMFYLDAASTATGSLAQSQLRAAFLRSPGMTWVFTGTLVAGTVVHLYAMRYVFDLPFYFVDYVPLLGLMAFTVIEVARGYGAMTRAANYAAASVPLAAMFVTIMNNSYDESSGLGAGLIADASLLLGALGILSAIAAFRHRRAEFVFLAMAYLFAGIVLGVPATPAGEPESINWSIVAWGGALLAFVFLLLHRNPLLWTAALVGAALFAPFVEPVRGWLEFQTLTDGDQAALRGVLLGAGLVMIGCLFGRRVHIMLLLSGAALLVLSVFNFTGFADAPGSVYVALTLAGMGVVAYWCTRNWLAVVILAIPAARVAYVGAGDAGGWRYIALGFALLVLGAVWSVLSHSRAVVEPITDDSNGS